MKVLKKSGLFTVYLSIYEVTEGKEKLWKYFVRENDVGQIIYVVGN